jgi:hypothetical protein
MNDSGYSAPIAVYLGTGPCQQRAQFYACDTACTLCAALMEGVTSAP